ncbi:Cyclic nucleotide-binding domain-containing protein 1 [Varanus komodoensis]|nr:Cyclic nucleotide-binding domain-containing protein 1 [Varanus komodoensis]
MVQQEWPVSQQTGGPGTWNSKPKGMLTGLQKVNCDRLDALLNINGLQNKDNPCTTEKAHQQFMEIYPSIFIKKPTILPGIPERRTKGVHSCAFSNDTSVDQDSHNIRFYLNQMKSSQKLRPNSPEFIEKLQGLIKILKKM